MILDAFFVLFFLGIFTTKRVNITLYPNPTQTTDVVLILLCLLSKLHHYTLSGAHLTKILETYPGSASRELIPLHSYCTTKSSMYPFRWITQDRLIMINAVVGRLEVTNEFCVVKSNSARLEYLLPTDMATRLIADVMVKYMLIEKTTPHHAFKAMEFMDLV